MARQGPAEQVLQGTLDLLTLKALSLWKRFVGAVEFVLTATA
jgi:hypothetical protein